MSMAEKEGKQLDNTFPSPIAWVLHPCDTTKPTSAINSNHDGPTKSRRRKNYMHIGTWNIQGLGTKTEAVMGALEKYEMDIVVLTETKKKGEGREELDDYIHIFSGIQEVEHAKSGVSILIHKQYSNSIIKWTSFNERILHVCLKLKERLVDIIGLYAPNNQKKNDVKDAFYKKLALVIKDLNENNELLLLGDLNARVGSQKDSQVIGQYGEEELNSSGKKLIKFCEDHSLKIYNGFFEHGDIYRYTWRKPSLDLKSIIDYVISKQEKTIQIFNVQAYQGAECGSDHYLLRANVGFPSYTVSAEHHARNTDVMPRENQYRTPCETPVSSTRGDKDHEMKLLRMKITYLEKIVNEKGYMVEILRRTIKDKEEIIKFHKKEANNVPNRVPNVKIPVNDDKDEQIQYFKEKFYNLKETLKGNEDLAKRLRQVEERNENLETTIQNKDEETKHLESALKDKDTEIKNLEDSLMEKEKLIAQLRSKVQETEELANTLREKEQALTYLEIPIKEREELAERAKILKEENKDLKKRLKEKDQIISSLKNEQEKDEKLEEKLPDHTIDSVGIPEVF